MRASAPAPTLSPMPLSFRFEEVECGLALRTPFVRERAPLLGARGARGVRVGATAPAPRAPVPTDGAVNRGAFVLLVVLVFAALTLGIYATVRTTETVNAAQALVEAISTAYWSGSVTEELALTQKKLRADAEEESRLAALLSVLVERVGVLSQKIGDTVRRR